MSTADAWTITNTRQDDESIAQHNSVFTISNGYLGLKGNLQEERAGPGPVTLINGVYDEIDQFGTLEIPDDTPPYLDPEHFAGAGKSPAIANLPNPLFVRVFVEDCEVVFGDSEVVSFSQSLDLKSGVYRYACDYRDAHRRTTRIEMARFASLKHAHRVFMRYTVTPVDHDAPIRLLSGIDPTELSSTTAELQFAVCRAKAGFPERCTLHARTLARKHDVYLGIQHVCRCAIPPSERYGSVRHVGVCQCYELTSAPGASITIERCIVLTCSEDARHGVAVDFENELGAAARQGFDAALEEQRSAWAELWDRADVEIDGDEKAQRYLRFCVYHLLAAAPRHTDKLSVPVKLLSGEYYQGNTFWDTDLYIVPFYIFTFPELARTCLNFRYKGLTCGRALARELGYQGAKLAWQAGPYGEECLGKWYRFCHTNIHLNADVAYSVMQYLWATGDETFLLECGIDILVETARFYYSRAAYDVEREGFTFEDVAGPDEAHCQSSSNFYTNYLALRNLRWAAKAVEHLREKGAERFNRVAKRLRLEGDEAEHWRDTANELVLLFDPQTKVYEQCEGFFELPPAPGNLLDGRKDWFARICPYQAMNQPDVVMALMLFREDFDAEVRRANWEFYKDKSMNFSSMSFAINAIAAADAGELDEAYRNFMISVGMDLDEQLTGRHDTCAGLHGTAMGGAWLAAIFGFGGVCFSEKGLRINPSLPAHWNSMRFNLVLRGEVVNVHINQREVVLRAENRYRIQLPVIVAGQEKTLSSGETIHVEHRA
jgi:kojibiose phosphorylase